MRYIKSFTNDNAIQAAVDDKSLGKPYVALDKATGTIDWNGKEQGYDKQYLTIEALSGGTFYVRKADIGYSVNGGEWETTTGATSLSLNQGDAVRFKGTAGGLGLFSGNTLAFNAYGNIESLEYGDDFMGKTEIMSDMLFMDCFSGCTGLSIVSNLVLPALTIYTNCYQRMFKNCTSIETAPDIPATTLKRGCYSSMFDGCTNLKYVKCLATKGLSSGAPLYNWLHGVSPTGTFVKAAGVSWESGQSGIPSGWTVIEE